MLIPAAQGVLMALLSNGWVNICAVLLLCPGCAPAPAAAQPRGVKGHKSLLITWENALIECDFINSHITFD